MQKYAVYWPELRRRSSQPVQRIYWPENVIDWPEQWRTACVMRYERGHKLQSFRREWDFCMSPYSVPPPQGALFRHLQPVFATSACNHAPRSRGQKDNLIWRQKRSNSDMFLASLFFQRRHWRLALAVVKYIAYKSPIGFDHWTCGTFSLTMARRCRPVVQRQTNLLKPWPAQCWPCIG